MSISNTSVFQFSKFSVNHKLKFNKSIFTYNCFPHTNICIVDCKCQTRHAKRQRIQVRMRTNTLMQIDIRG